MSAVPLGIRFWIPPSARPVTRRRPDVRRHRSNFNLDIRLLLPMMTSYVSMTEHVFLKLNSGLMRRTVESKRCARVQKLMCSNLVCLFHRNNRFLSVQTSDMQTSTGDVCTSFYSHIAFVLACRLTLCSDVTSAVDGGGRGGLGWTMPPSVL